MVNTIGDRILFLIKDLNINQKEFAQSIKADATHINKIIKGKSNPSDSLMYLICERYGVNFDWLKHGTGITYMNKQSAQYTEALKIFNLLDDDLQEFALSQLEQLLKLQKGKKGE